MKLAQLCRLQKLRHRLLTRSNNKLTKRHLVIHFLKTLHGSSFNIRCGTKTGRHTLSTAMPPSLSSGAKRSIATTPKPYIPDSHIVTIHTHCSGMPRVEMGSIIKGKGGIARMSPELLTVLDAPAPPPTPDSGVSIKKAQQTGGK